MNVDVSSGAAVAIAAVVCLLNLLVLNPLAHALAEVTEAAAATAAASGEPPISPANTHTHQAGEKGKSPGNLEDDPQHEVD
ncbi:hypothetical protein AJ80_09293 [Polytolypa hystricis UAMH7299]|uniref:Uncharacterized protein n=1 Tax=Polytolypa hystricis (strain UAMH7299) TaxID=1447883 RepID=A0A2B7WTL2_POLH7|nr:hypothetical protein AJ80_09293 [Polytolypa hystricis UAMH7299]